MIIVDNGVNNGNCVGNCLNNHIGNENGNLNNGDGKYVSLCAILRTRNIYPEVIRGWDCQSGLYSIFRFDVSYDFYWKSTPFLVDRTLF